MSTIGKVSNDFGSAGWQATLFWYSQAFYDIVQNLGFEAAKEIAEAAGRYSLEHPLWIQEKPGKFKEFDLPHIGKKSGPYLIAVQGAFLVWTQKQLTDNPLPDSPILKACEDGWRLWKLSRGESPLGDDQNLWQGKSPISNAPDMVQSVDKTQKKSKRRKK